MTPEELEKFARRKERWTDVESHVSIRISLYRRENTDSHLVCLLNQF